jgi:hypothetical protein
MRSQWGSSQRQQNRRVLCQCQKAKVANHMLTDWLLKSSGHPISMLNPEELQQGKMKMRLCSRRGREKRIMMWVRIRVKS